MKKIVLLSVVLLTLCVPMLGQSAEEKKPVDKARIELLQERLARIEAQSILLQQQYAQAKQEFDSLVAAAKAEAEKKEKKDEVKKPDKK